MRVALIHDHLAQDGGAEKVLAVLAEMFKEAPIFTLLYDPANADKHFKDRFIYTSIIQRLPGGVRHYKWFLPIMPLAVEFFDLSGFDVVISDTSSFAKGVITGDHTLHICYCHTPTRYLWSDTHSYIQEMKMNKYLKKIVALFLNKLRIWDLAAADRPDCFIANSRFIARRINRYYHRPSEVIYPPVATDKFAISQEIDDYFLAGGRLVPYKRFDLLINAFKVNGKKLKIFGNGPDLPRLKSLAGSAENIEFSGWVSDEDKRRLYARALAFLNPQEEDFGITMVEALASGRPVIAYKAGGAREIVEPGVNGYFFAEQKIESLNAALVDFRADALISQQIKQSAEKFSEAAFKDNFIRFLEKKQREFKTV